MSADKPGDVALVTYKASDMTRESQAWRAIRWRYGWIISGEDGYEIVHEPSVRSARPLVVIDPDDAEQVERLADAVITEGRGYRIDKAIITVGLTKGLREFASPTPPKPEEPKNVGAIVAYNGELWVRTDWATWRCLTTSDLAPREWRDFSTSAQVCFDGIDDSDVP